MEKIKLYALCDNISKEIRYIGYTKKSLNERLFIHKRNVKEAFETKTRKINKRLSWLKSINCNVDIILIDEAFIDDLYWVESFYINLFKHWGFKLTNGTEGGDGGNTWSKLSEEDKKLASMKLSKSLKGKNKVKTLEHEQKILEKLKIYNQKIKDGFIQHPSKGKPMTEAQRKAFNRTGISNVNKGISKYGKINQYDLNGNFISQYENPILAAQTFFNVIIIGDKKINHLKSNIVRAAKGLQKSCNGFIWKFE